jgi:2,3-bisphosphoglycerate-independent phosphoglycerate mutase
MAGTDAARPSATRTLMAIPYSKVFLIVLDGFGLAGREPGNAILEAGMPYLDSLIAQYPSLSVAASGLVVGLPWGQPGNSEVGHSAIGTGRIVIQDLAHINGEIRSGDFYKNPALLEAVEHAKKNDSALHLMGCTSPGGIHAHTDHLIALLELASRKGLKKIFVHFIADGQDAPPQDAIHVLEMLAPYIKKAGAHVASIQGRSYAMDRVLNWKLTEMVWHAVVLGDAPPIENAADYLKAEYEKGVTDYALKPATVMKGGAPVGPVQDNDAFIFYDFRNDRVKQKASTLIFADTFKEFEPVRRPKNLKVVTMTKYAEEFNVPVAYPAPALPNTLGEVVSAAGIAQWRIAEKEKEAHVTNFFNGGRIKAFTGEQRDIVSSRQMKGPEYLQHPEMSAQGIVDSVLKHAGDDSRLYVINFANPDMIGHTGNFDATVKAIHVTDDCLKQVVEPLRAHPDIAVIITADHGNAEELLDPLTKGEDTQHSTRNVPALFVSQSLEGKQDSGKSLEALAQEAPIGTLVDIAPTALYMLGIDKPIEMTGSRLISEE